MTDQVIESTVDTSVSVDTSVEAPQEAQIAETGVEPIVTPETIDAPAEESVESTDAEPVVAEPIVLDNLKYGDAEISLNIPEEAVKMATDKGFDASELAQELFTSKDFQFSEETYTKLVDAYGKMFVDMSIQNLKLNNDAMLREASDARTKGEAEAFEAISGAVGGEEGWGKLEAFAATLPQEDTDAFNAAMESGNPMFQKFAVEALMARMPASKEAKPLELIDGKPSIVSAPTAISAKEYREAMGNGEYYKDPAKWDGLRRAGIQSGI